MTIKYEYEEYNFDNHSQCHNSHHNSQHLRIWIEEGELPAIGHRILSMGKDEVIKRRWELFQDINGKIFFPLKM